MAMSLRLPTDLHKELSDVAKQEQRSVNAQIIYVLQQWLERQRRPAQRSGGEQGAGNGE